ncbi:c-type cytochrome [candidate division TA06 bacterium]|nr:c-type cytochrome [candidate division TA06 bacterium]
MKKIFLLLVGLAFKQRRSSILCVLLAPAAGAGVLCVSAVNSLAQDAKIPETPENIEAGRKIYQESCIFCHGEKGKGEGHIADYLWPRPRDFTAATFKLRTTASGEVPFDSDLFQTITNGIPGTAMPEWGSLLSEKERWQVIHYIKTFAQGDYDEPPAKANLGKKIGASKEIINEGKILYALMKCWQCHGKEGRGDGPSAYDLKDEWGFIIPPADLTQGWKYRGGSRVEDIYTRFSTGMSGTPMPDFTDAAIFLNREGYQNLTPFEPVYTEEELQEIKTYIETLPTLEELGGFSEEKKAELSNRRRWALAHYIRSLITVEGPNGDVVIKSEEVEGDLPMDPDNPLWEKAKPLIVPLTGQVITKPRWQIPTVQTIFVRALHNDQEIAFLVEWSDPSQDTLHEGSDWPSVGQTSTVDTETEDTYPLLSRRENPAGSRRDALSIQFPTKIPVGPQKPYFFWGEKGNPVNLWHWKSDWQVDLERETPIEKFLAKGFRQWPEPEPPESQNVEGSGIWRKGQWRVILKRSLTTEEKEIQFEKGAFIPIAFQAWDGSNGEVGYRMSLSSWVYLLLPKAKSLRVYFNTLLGVILAVGFESWLVRRVRRKKN